MDTTSRVVTMPTPVTEVEAIRLAQEGSRWQRIRVGLIALSRLMRNPDDTKQVFIVGIALNASSFPGFVARITSSAAGAALASERPLINSQTVDFAALRKLPQTTLGGAYVRYLDENKLDPDLFQPPPGLPELPRWIAARIRQTHDIWHTLTGYKPDVPGEIALQGFTYAQLEMPSALLLAVLGTITRAPLAAPEVLRAYRRGKAAAFLPVVRFEDMWERPLEDVRRELGISACV